DALHARGIRVIVYYNIWNRWAHDQFPSWRMVRADGRSTIENPDGSPSRFGQCCMNNEGYRTFVRAQIADLCTRFACEGLWIDMIGYFGTVCCCASCRDRYLRETGKEIPQTVDWEDPEWVRFVRHRETWFDDFTAMVQKTALDIQPELSLAFQSTSMLSGWGGGATQTFLDRSTYLAGDFYGAPIQYSVICKYINNLTSHRPMEFMTSRCYDLAYHTTTKPDVELKRSALGAFAHNAAFVFIDAMDPLGTIDGAFYRRMARIKAEVAPFEQAVSHTATLVADIAFYRNFASDYEPTCKGQPLRSAQTRYPVVSDLAGIGRTMTAAHIAYDLIGLPQLSCLQRYQTVILASEHVLSDDEVAAMRAYVQGGGVLIVTGETGLHDPDGVRRADFPLCDVLGVHYEGETREDRTYIAPTPLGKPYFEENNERYPLALSTHQTLVRAEADVEILGTVTLPYSSSDEIHSFGSAISNPPAYATSYPAVTRRRYGAGWALYIASPLEKETLRPQRRTFAALASSQITASVTTNAPEWLELIVFQDAPRHRYQLSVMSVAQDATDLLARGVQITMHIPQRVVSICTVGTGQSLAFVQTGEYVQCTLEEFVDFTMCLIDYAAEGGKRLDSTWEKANIHDK
ncbi:MAG: hypothetical protein RR482_06065, partial [Clostridia bacterium]